MMKLLILIAAVSVALVAAHGGKDKDCCNPPAKCDDKPKCEPYHDKGYSGSEDYDKYPKKDDYGKEKYYPKTDDYKEDHKKDDYKYGDKPEKYYEGKDYEKHEKDYGKYGKEYENYGKEYKEPEYKGEEDYKKYEKEYKEPEYNKGGDYKKYEKDECYQGECKPKKDYDYEKPKGHN